jgi:hypothetical protein
MRIVLTFLLLMAATSVMAEWVKVGKSSRTSYKVFSDETVYYIDPATITSEGNLRRVWEIFDLSDKGPDGERSVLASVEYDCAEKRMRTLKATGRTLRMARGEIIPLIRFLDDWIILQRGKDDEIFFKILDTVCAR